MTQTTSTHYPQASQNGGTVVWHDRALAVGFPLLLVALWQMVHSVGWVNPTLLPSPRSTGTELFRMLVSGDVLPDLAWTLLRMAAGLTLGMALGIALGLLMGIWRPAYAATIIPVDFFRSTPVTILYPVFVLLLGISHMSMIAMVCVGSVFVIALNTAYGVIQANPTRRQMARLFGASHYQIMRWIIIYDALPQILVGIRIALSLALVVQVLCELFMGSRYGLGQRVAEAYSMYAIEQMYALILIVGFTGFILNRVFVRIERAITPWVNQSPTSW